MEFVNNLMGLIDEQKENITSQVYREMCDNLMKISQHLSQEVEPESEDESEGEYEFIVNTYILHSVDSDRTMLFDDFDDLDDDDRLEDRREHFLTAGNCYLKIDDSRLIKANKDMTTNLFVYTLLEDVDNTFLSSHKLLITVDMFENI